MIKLSQCMIVKNEEKNIEKALGWAKPVAYEQIVVDTGSTDKTVELAEKMGAKVYHFKWIDDFAAAKNHAIEQATGNWIAFLDADEYFTAEDAEKLITELKKIKSNNNLQKQTNILNMPWVQLDDHGGVTSVSEQTRVFRNIKKIRYVGKIHEQISVYGAIKRVDDISIMHTGYAETEYREKGKAERNIKMLRAELAGRPGDLKLKAYLADSLVSRMLLDKIPNAEDIAEVDAIYGEVIKNDKKVPSFLMEKAHKYLLWRKQNNPEKTAFGPAEITGGTMPMNKHLEQFNHATDLMLVGRLEEALVTFLELEKDPEFSPFCYYRIAQISNMIGEPEEAYELYYKAFTAMPDIASRMFSEDHTSFNYVFRGKKNEKVTTKCPLCGVESEPHWCYSLIEAAGYNEFFNPVRMWMYCSPCNHMFAREFPEKLFLYNDSPRKANPAFFPYYSNVLASMRRSGYAEGMTLFEVGIGACECLLAAREIGYETFGIDVIERHVEDAKSKYDLDAETIDFLEFESDRKWDIIIMGDVLEHVSDPDLALAKAESLLHDTGALWISTPTFESAFSCIAGHNDVMRKQQFHLNYFSRESLYALLERNYLFPVDYQISAHFNGSMEVIAVKESRA